MFPKFLTKSLKGENGHTSCTLLYVAEIHHLNLPESLYWAREKYQNHEVTLVFAGPHPMSMLLFNLTILNVHQRILK